MTDKEVVDWIEDNVVRLEYNCGEIPFTWEVYFMNQASKLDNSRSPNLRKAVVKAKEIKEKQ